jgi:hypothetical protein
MQPAVNHLRDDELSRLFADWSTPVIVQRIDQHLDSDFDDVSEGETSFEVEAIQWPLRTSSTGQTRLQHATTECQFTLRAIDIPEGLAPTACRILASGRSWDVTGVTRSADGRLLHLRGQAT